jgi:predicted nucleotidyltransferase component of viral defense system
MTIEEVLNRAVFAVYAAPILAKRLVLKGGAASRILYKKADRLSLDDDFSIEGQITNKTEFSRALKRALSNEFSGDGLDVIDFTFTPRPRKRSKPLPDWWGGWQCEFKLLSRKDRRISREAKSRRALVPTGANSPKISLDLSENEYCGAVRHMKRQGITITGYAKELIVVEKLRALCQQHSDYKYGTKKNRSRDLYDIYALSADANTPFWKKCAKHIAPSFAAKNVDLKLLDAFWDDAFIDELRRGFASVEDDVSGELLDFDIYLEHTRFVILQIRPEDT